MGGGKIGRGCGGGRGISFLCIHCSLCLAVLSQHCYHISKKQEKNVVHCLHQKSKKKMTCVVHCLHVEGIRSGDFAACVTREEPQHLEAAKEILAAT